MPDIHALVERVTAYDKTADEDLITRADRYAESAHEGQKRASGEPYIMHPRAVARILSELKLDDATIATGLLHDVIEDTHASYEDLVREFGQEVADLVNGVTKIRRLDLVTKQEAQAENFRKLLLAISSDIRVLIVKLADRLHNMRTLGHVSRERQARIAQETLDIYAPLAGRMGMNWLREELEDLCFRALHPEAYQTLSSKLSELETRNRGLLGEITLELHTRLQEQAIPAHVSARQKRLYSIWRKIENKRISFEQLSDIYGFRIITDSLDDCYRVLGVIHTRWRTVPGRFKDYISTPKPNGYKSIHTTIIGPGSQRVELQIRTRDMHDIAEYGVAAHTLYKDGVNEQGRKQRRLGQESDAYKWLKELVEVHLKSDNPKDFLEHTKLELFQDQVFCFTPQGSVIVLPRGASAIDFAYAVHTDIGNQCVGCKINGRHMSRRSVLHNGDEVEILTSSGQRPDATWEGMVKTGKARAAIRRATRHDSILKFSRLGREILSAEFEKLGREYDEDIVKTAIRRLARGELEDVLVAVGRGELDRKLVMRAVEQRLPSPDGRRQEEHKRAAQEEGWFSLPKVMGLRFKLPGFSGPAARSSASTSAGTSRQPGCVPVAGVGGDLPVSFATRGGAVPGDRIVGILDPDKGITIYPIWSEALHQFDDQPERWVDVAWQIEEGGTQRFPSCLVVSALNQPGSLGEIARVIGEKDGNIDRIEMTRRGEVYTDMQIDLEVIDLKHLNEILRVLNKMSVVHEASRVME